MCLVLSSYAAIYASYTIRFNIVPSASRRIVLAYTYACNITLVKILVYFIFGIKIETFYSFSYSFSVSLPIF